MKEKIPSLSTRISDNSGYQEVDEADIETSAAQEVTAENGDNISEVSSEFGTFYGVSVNGINGNKEDKDTGDINNDNIDVSDRQEEINSDMKRKRVTKYKKGQEKLKNDEHK